MVRIGCARGFLIIVTALLLTFASGFRGDQAVARSLKVSNAKTWLDKAVAGKHCPSSPVNVPAALLQTSAAGLQQQISIVGTTLQIEGTPNPDHIVIKAGGAHGFVRVKFNGRHLGTFGPVAQILVQGGDGDDVIVVKPGVDLPARLEGGAGDDCLQGGSGADLLLAGDGDDVVIAGTGRPALDAGPGSNRIVFPPSMGVLRVAPSAAGEFLPLIAGAYTLQPLRQGHRRSLQGRHRPPGQSNGLPSPIILGPADLGDSGIIAQLQQTYDAGQAVVLTDATAADAEQLRRLLGHPNSAGGLKGSETAALIFVRKAPRPGTKAYDYSTGIFQHAPTAASPAAKRDLDKRRIELLSRVFSATAIVPEGPVGSPSNDLLKLADSYTSSDVYSIKGGSQVQAVNSVWDVRSFQNQADFYYVLQEVDFVWGAGQPGLDTYEAADAAETRLGPAYEIHGPTLIQPSPASTTCSVSTTSGVSWSIGGSTGWNQTQGLDADLTGGVSVSNSKTITCPQITINNESNPANGAATWTYTIPRPSATPQLNSFYNQWVWEVPFSSYNAGQANVQLTVEADSTFRGEFCYPNGTCPGLGIEMEPTVPLPFGDTFALQKPVVLSVNPTCVNAGNTFVINGTGMYPSLVTSVLIGGTPLAAGQYTTTSDTAINVVAPEESGEFLPVAVQTAEGVSNSNVTMEISVIDLCQ